MRSYIALEPPDEVKSFHMIVDSLGQVAKGCFF